MFQLKEGKLVKVTPETKTQRARKAAVARPAQVFNPTIEEYEGKPLVRLHWQFAFGPAKARLILANLEMVKAVAAFTDDAVQS